MNQTNANSDSPAKTISELFFTLLPFIVFSIIFLYKNNLTALVDIPEWSFASAILNGQLIVKLARSFPGEFGSAVLSGVIVLLLVPSLVVLGILVLNEEPSFILSQLQLMIFSISLLAYVGLIPFIRVMVS